VNDDDEPFQLPESQAKRMFNVDEKSKYLLVVTEITSLEDAGDNFYTCAELCELVGSTYVYPGNLVRTSIAKEALSGWAAQLNDKKKSIIITDQELIDTMTEQRIAASDLIGKGYRRVGARLTKFTTAVRDLKPSKSLCDKLISSAITAVDMMYHFDFELKSTMVDRENAVRLLQKLITWEQMWQLLDSRETITHADRVKKDLPWSWHSYRSSSAEEREVMKQIWDKPEMFPRDPHVPEDDD
jgi:hypothetical protein